MSRLTALSLTSIALCASVRAQNHVLVVSPTGPYTQIQAAVDAANDRDTVLVEQGVYVGFAIADKGITVVADTDAVVQVIGAVSVTGLASTRDVVLLGLRIDVLSGNPEPALRIQDDVGSVRVERCSLRCFTDQTGSIGARVENASDVAFLRCDLLGGNSTVHGGGSGLFAIGSRIAMYDCSTFGGFGGDYSCPCEASSGGDGATLLGCFFFASQSHFAGGGGGNANTGCFGCGCGADGGAGGNGIGILYNPPSTVELLDNSYVGGPGGSEACGSCGGCGGFPGLPGGTVVGLGATFLPGAGRELQAASPARELVPVTLQIQGRPGDRVWLFVSRDTGFRWVPGYKGVQIPKLPSPPTFLGTIGASGSFSATYTVPELGPGKETRNYYLQTAHQDSAGAWTFGSAVDLVGLDAAF